MINKIKPMVVATALGSAACSVAQSYSPSTDNAIYDGITIDGLSNKLQIKNMWMFDNTIANNPINHPADPTVQMLTQMLVCGNNLYIPQFKTTFPSAQKIYIYNAYTGEPLNGGDPVAIEGLGEDDDNSCMTFQSIGVISDVLDESDKYFLVGAPSTRISDKNYVSDWENNPRFVYYSLDLSDSPVATCKGTAKMYSKSYPKSTYSKIVEAMSFGGFSAKQYSDGGIVFLGDALLDSSVADVNSTLKNIGSNIKVRSGFFADLFYLCMKKEDKYTSADYIGDDNLFSYAKADYRLKSQMDCLTGGSDVEDRWMFVNFADNSTGGVAPCLLKCKQGDCNATMTKLTYADENIKTDSPAGDAIAHFVLNGKHYIVYTSSVSSDKTCFQIAYLPDCTDTTPAITNAEALWQIPANGLSVTDKTVDGENITSVYVNVENDGVDGSEVAYIYLYAQGQALAAYSMGENLVSTSANDISTESSNVRWHFSNNTLSVTTNQPATVNIYSSLGACVLTSNDANIDLSNLSNGIYIAKCDSSAYKFAIK